MLSRLNIIAHGLGTLFSDALPIITQFAPTFGAVLAGPAGFASGYAVPILAAAFNALPKNAHDIVKSILDDKDAPTKLKDLEFNHGSLLSSMFDSLSCLSEAEINIKLKWGNSDAVRA